MVGHDERSCLARDTPGRSLLLDDFLSGMRSERSEDWRCCLRQNEGVDDRKDCNHASLLTQQSGWRSECSLACTSGSNPMNVANERWSTGRQQRNRQGSKVGKDCRMAQRSGLPRMLSSISEVEIQKNRKGQVCTSGGLNCWNSGEVSVKAMATTRPDAARHPKRLRSLDFSS